MPIRENATAEVLDEASLVAAIEEGQRTIDRHKQNHLILLRSLEMFEEAHGIVHEMSRLERVIALEEGKIRVAAAQLRTINPSHPILEGYPANENTEAEEPLNWRGRLKKLFRMF